MTDTETSTPTPARLAPLAVVLGALLFTLGDLCRRLVVGGADDSLSITHAVADRPGLWLLAASLSLLAPVAFVPGLGGLAAGVGGRGGRTTRIGAALLGVGMLASIGHAVAFYSPYALYARAHTPAADLTALDHTSWVPLGVVVVVFIVGMVSGTLTLLVGLRRAGRVPVWSVLAGLLFVVLGSTGGVAAGLVAVPAALCAFGPAALAARAPAQLPIERQGRVRSALT